ncbi:hypothetical protein C8F04DRAFT_1274893 [Mycena alexandri]|uniref:Uncharacterized protein n=1 Tax=Mycena alexandri TaxID=1745969 RepID=A0AAD6WTP2_9AGAR|nr:hypothetical protein C8F04DRAFT_1274893 [Mycena alexandri]
MSTDEKQESRASVPTSELTTTQIGHRLPTTSTRRLLTAQEEAEEDRALLISYYERIGKRQRIHEAAIHHHMKFRNKDSLALVVSTFDSLYRTEMQTPPPLVPEGSAPVDAKAAIARGRTLAFTQDPSEMECAWTYNNQIRVEALETAGAERNPNIASNDTDPAAASNSARRTAFSANEAKLALDRIQDLARRLLPQRESDCDLLD